MIPSQRQIVFFFALLWGKISHSAGGLLISLHLLLLGKVLNSDVLLSKMCKTQNKWRFRYMCTFQSWTVTSQRVLSFRVVKIFISLCTIR